MASIALDPAYRRVSVEEFLDMDFHGARAELEDGVIFMMAGGSEAHSRVAVNLSSYLRIALRGSGCRPYNSDFAVRTGAQTARLPDLSIYCGDPSAVGNERKQLLGDPRVVFEVLSPSTSSYDYKVKLAEYRDLPGVQEVVLIDPDAERVRLVRRNHHQGWNETVLDAGADLVLVSVEVTIPHSEIFARD